MQCPFCHEDKDRVVDSRSLQGARIIRRRRECLACRRRYTTYERVEETPLKVIKKDGSRQDFNRGKLLAGLSRAGWKRPNVTEAALNQLVTDIEQALHEEHLTEIPSQVLGQRVMARLRQLDEVAYIRFASVYYDFRDVQEFVRAVTKLGRDSHPAG